MSDKYEENFWGQIDSLHQKSKRQQIAFNYLIDMLTKFQDGCSSFTKSLQSALVKSYEIVEFHSMSMYDLSQRYAQTYETFSNQFKEACNSLKKQITDPLTKPTNEIFNKEKELYNSYNKLRSAYNNAKSDMEKYHQKYESNMKLCENLIFNSKQMNLLPYAREDEKKKNAKSANDSIKATKQIEEKYKTSVENINKARDNEIKKQTEILQFYKKLDLHYYEKIKNILGIFLVTVNKMCQSLLSSTEFFGQSYQKVSIEDDITDYISKNRMDIKIQPRSKFIPYVPSSDPTQKIEDTTKLDIYFDVIKELKLHFKDIRPDIDMEEETKRKRLRFLCQRIFKFGNNVTFSSEEKNELMQFLDNPSFRSYFLVVLSKQRTKGRFKRSEILVRDLSELLLKILDLAEKQLDYVSAKNCVILSQTFYYEGASKTDDTKKKDNAEEEKIYLFELIKNNKWLTSLEFWDGLLNFCIEGDIKKNEANAEKQGLLNNENARKKRLANVCFSQLLTYTVNMIEFGIDKKRVESTVEKYSKRYGLTQDLIDTVNGSIEMKMQQMAHNENKEDIKQKTNTDKEKKNKKDKKDFENVFGKEEKLDIVEENISADNNNDKPNNDIKVILQNNNEENVTKEENKETLKDNVEKKEDLKNEEKKDEKKIQITENTENKNLENEKGDNNDNVIKIEEVDEKKEELKEKKDEVKEEVKDEVKEEVKDEVKEEVKEVKEEKEEEKEEKKLEIKEEEKEEVKQEVKDEIKVEIKEEDINKDNEKTDKEEEKK